MQPRYRQFTRELAASARLPVMPWRLATVAADATVEPSAFIGVAGASAGIGAALALATAAVGEPFADFTDYLGSAAYAAIFMALFVVIPAAGVSLILQLAARDPSGGMSPRRRARLCAALLSPMTVLPGMIAWGLCVAILQVRSPRFGLGVAKPRWIEWVLFDAAAVALPLIMLGGLFANLCYSFFRTAALPDSTSVPDFCPDCHYPLHGLPANSRCPECGGDIPAPPTST